MKTLKGVVSEAGAYLEVSLNEEKEVLATVKEEGEEEETKGDLPFQVQWSLPFMVLD